MPLPAPPDDLALLTDGFANDKRVLEESISNELRNALMMLNCGLESPSGGLVTFTIEDVASIRARIQNALDLAESPCVIDARSLSQFMDDLATQRTV